MKPYLVDNDLKIKELPNFKDFWYCILLKIQIATEDFSSDYDVIIPSFGTEHSRLMMLTCPGKCLPLSSLLRITPNDLLK